jgi:hypothetical protein
MQNFGPYMVGTAFWLCLGACAVAGIVTDYKRRRLGVEVVRSAIEKGQQLDPALIEKLTSSSHGQHQRIEPVHLRLGGIITIAAGIGVCPLSWFVGTVMPAAVYPILGVGVLAICVGIGLLIGSKTLAQVQERERAHSTPP